MKELTAAQHEGIALVMGDFDFDSAQQSVQARRWMGIGGQWGWQDEDVIQERVNILDAAYRVLLKLYSHNVCETSGGGFTAYRDVGADGEELRLEFVSERSIAWVAYGSKEERRINQ